MAIRKVLKGEAPLLRKISKPVKEFNPSLWELLDDMKETMLSLKLCAGLAAPQVGVLKRLFVVNAITDKNQELYMEFINPEIISQSGEQFENDAEGCMSLPDVWGYVRRPNKVTVRAFDRHGKEFTKEFEDFFARLICHENDHLNGELFSDKIEKDFDPEEYKAKRKAEREARKKAQQEKK